MINRLYITRLAAALLLLGGCAKETPPIEPTQPQPMRFAAFLQEGDKVRPLNTASNAASNAASRTIDGTLDNGFHLFVSPLNTISYICDNMKVAANGTLSSPSFWMQSVSNYSIGAYATASGTKLSATHNSASVVSNIAYTVVNDPALQEDLLTASIGNLAVSYDKPLVNLYFRHALSRVVFKLQRTMAGPSIYDVKFKITYVANKVRNGANIPVIPKSGVGITTSSTYHAGTFSLGTPFSHSAGETQPVTIGDVIIVPQTVPQGGIIIEMSYKLDPAAGTAVQTLATELNSFAIAAEQQMDINIGYSVEVDQLVVQGVSLTDWTNTSGRLDIYK